MNATVSHTGTVTHPQSEGERKAVWEGALG